MKAILNGLLYNTATATKVAVVTDISEDQASGSATSALYITERGAWYLHICDKVPDQGKRERLLPIGEIEAKKWTEEHFGQNPPPQTLKRILKYLIFENA